MNQSRLKNENADIDKYLRTHNLSMTTSGSGLRYLITKNATSEKKSPAGARVVVAYELQSLSGQVYYTFDKNHSFLFTLGRAEIIKGIEEAVTMMNVGDEALLLIPSHLAFGNSGDNDRIAPDESLVCKLSLMKIE